MKESVLPQTWQIPPVIRKRVGHRVGRQRAMLEEGHLLLILHAPPEPDQVSREGRFFWRNERGEWASNDGTAGHAGLEKHLEDYARSIHAVDQAEERGQTSRDYFQVIDQLAPVLRATRHLHQVLQEARKLMPEAAEIIDLRDRAYELERTAELLMQDAKNSLEFLVAWRAEEQADSSYRVEQGTYRLNLLVAFFFPLATLMAFFGMNVSSQLSEMQESPLTFVLLVTAGLGAGVFIQATVASKPPKPRSSPAKAHREPAEV